MAEKINRLVLDLSHHDPADDYAAVKRAGIIGIIFKSTEGGDYQDPTYFEQRQLARRAGLLWGSYHFASGSSVENQIDNYLRFTQPAPDELICFDWEDNPTSSAGMMSLADAKIWIREVEHRLNRPGQVVIYSGNTAKEQIRGNDPFFGSRRLWLAHYTSSPTWQESWDSYWLWQYSETGEVPGIDEECDENSFKGTAEQLRNEWAAGADAVPEPVPPDTDIPVVEIALTVPAGIGVRVTVNGEDLLQ